MLRDPAARAAGVRFELVTTRSGARALRDNSVGEVMHPGLGPVDEAQRLHVAAAALERRLRASDPQPLVLFDVGLGAGSNAAQAIALVERIRPPRDLWIYSFENDLAAFAFAIQHSDEFGLPRRAGDLLASQATGLGWTWNLADGDALERIAAQPLEAEVLFWDPFSFRANPQLWSVRAFSTALANSRADAVLTTYSNSTTVRTAMLLAGWAVGRGPVLEAGRETTVAARDVAMLEAPLDAGFLAKRVRSSAPWPEDAPEDAMERLERCVQFARG